MLKLMNKKQKTTTNKGFSLVELIVVIAIMAVLVAVLAPAMMKYIERSRKSTDASTISNLVSSAQAGVIDQNVSAGKYTLTVTDGCVVTGPDDANKGKLEAALKESYNDLKEIKLKSEWKTKGVVVTMIIGSNGQTTISYDSPGVTGDNSFAKFTDLPQTGNQQQGGN